MAMQVKSNQSLEEGKANEEEQQVTEQVDQEKATSDEKAKEEIESDGALQKTEEQPIRQELGPILEQSITQAQLEPSLKPQTPSSEHE